MENGGDAQLAEISKKLDILIGLQATTGRDQDQQILVLDALGYGPVFIAPLVGMKPHAVTMRLARKRKAGVKKGGRNGNH